MNKIAIIGAGKFGVALANSLLNNAQNDICLFTGSADKSTKFLNEEGKSSVFPNLVLNKGIRIQKGYEDLINYEVVFLAIPSFAMPEIVSQIKPYLKKGTFLVNLAKGLISAECTITDFLSEQFKDVNVCTMKGPTFASELVTGASSIFTVGYSNKEALNALQKITKNTNIYLDFSHDIRGVELYSLIKNIYAIVIGYIDARYDSANTRFLILTKAFQEMKILGTSLGASEDTAYLSCGLGDLGLTSLNDLSRNRTLGLLIGKGFVTSQGNNVVMEGVKAIELLTSSISPNILRRLPLFNLVSRIIAQENVNAEIDFDELLKESETTVLTYGTFDLLHYGHLELLRRAHNYGSKLIVGLSTDEFNIIKGKKSVHSYAKRKELLESISFISAVIPENDWNQKIKDVIDHNVDIFIMGDDWKGKFDFLEKYCKVEYLPRTKGISTTDLKKLIE